MLSTLVQLRAAAVHGQSNKIAALFFANWGFGAAFLDLATTCVYKKHRLAFRLSHIKLMPRYFLESVREYRGQLRAFFDRHIEEIRAKLYSDISKGKFSLVRPLNAESIPDFRARWVEAMVLSRKHGHYDLVMFFFSSRAFVLAKRSPL